MKSFNLQQNIKVKVEKNNNFIHRYKRRITSLFRFIEACIFLFIISTIFSTQIPLPSTQHYFKRLYIALISPLFVFVLGNAIVIVLFLLTSRESSPKDDSTFLDYNTYIIPSCKQVKRKMYRSQSEKLIVRPNNRVLRRSVTVACRRYSEKPAAEMTGEEFRSTVEAFIARQQSFLREEEFSAVLSIEP